MMTKYKNRVLVSFGGYCPMKCKHCYTYEIEERRKEDSVGQLVEGISDKEFDVIYVSQSYENFFDEGKGIELCRGLFERYKKDILIITRSRLSDAALDALAHLCAEMKESGNRLYLAVSCFADESYGISENVELCATPEERLENLRRAYERGIHTILLLRPIFPSAIVPVRECMNLILRAKGYVDAVVSSGLIVTERILERLQLQGKELAYDEDGDSDYLKDLPKENVHFLDVEEELKQLEVLCGAEKVAFFRHSMPALNYIAGGQISEN